MVPPPGPERKTDHCCGRVAPQSGNETMVALVLPPVLNSSATLFVSLKASTLLYNSLLFIAGIGDSLLATRLANEVRREKCKRSGTAEYGEPKTTSQSFTRAVSVLAVWKIGPPSILFCFENKQTGLHSLLPAFFVLCEHRWRLRHKLKRSSASHLSLWKRRAPRRSWPTF